MYVDLEMLKKSDTLQPVKKQVNESVASSSKLFTHNEHAPVEVRVVIDSDDDADWWNGLEPPIDTQNIVEPKGVEKINTYSEKTKVIEEIKVVEKKNMYRKKTKQRKAVKNAKIKVLTDIKRKSVEDYTDLSITKYEPPKKVEQTQSQKRRKKFIKECTNHFVKKKSMCVKITPTPDIMISKIVPVNTKSHPAKTYKNLAPKFKQDSSSPSPCQPLNTTDHFLNPDLLLNYNSNFLEAVKSCFEASKDRPDSCLEMTCEVCSISFKNNLVLLIRHLNYYHRTKKVYIESDISPEHVRLVAIKARESRFINLCLRLAIEKACSIQPTDDLTILSYKCYMCLKSWEHYIYFRNHMSGHLDMVIKTENSIRDRHLFVHVVADAPKIALKDRNMNLPIYSATGSRVYKCFKCDSYYYDKMDQHYHETRAKCLGCRKIGPCHVIKRHENSCAQLFANFFPRTCQCGKVLNSKVVVLAHQHACSLAKSMLAFYCNVCNHRTLTIDLLKAHLMNKHMVRSDAYMYQPAVQCEICNELYAGPFEQHVCTKHEYCSCSVCDQSFENSTLLACHMKAYNEGAICYQCPDTLRLEKGCLMMEHEIVHHTSDRMIVHVCMFCSQMYTTHLYLKMHLLTHDEESTKLVYYRSKKIYPFKKDIVVEQNQCFNDKGNVPSVLSGNRKKKKYIRPDTTYLEYFADVAEQIGIKVKDKVPNIKKKTTKDLNELLPENLEKAHDANNTQNNMKIVEKEIILEQSNSNIVKDENLCNQNSRNNKKCLLENSTKVNEAIIEQNNMVVREIKVGQDYKINVENLNLRIHTVVSINNNKELLPENSESSCNIINTQNNIEIVDKIIDMETNTTKDIPPDEDPKLNSTVFDNKSETERRANENIDIQECNTNCLPVIAKAKDTVELMQADEVEKHNLSTFSVKESGQANTSFDVHYEKMNSSAGLQEVVECEESEWSTILENKETKRDINGRYMELIRAISDDAIINEEKTDYGNGLTENALVTSEYTPNHENTSEIVQEEVEPHIFVSASGGTAFKLEIKEEPYDDIDAEDVVIFKKGAEENEMSEQTIEQFILNNSEITMPEIEPEDLLIDFFESDTCKKVKKDYHCTKCDFVGIHRLYKEHKESCVKIHPQRKNHPQLKNASMLMSQITEYSCSKCGDIFENLRDYLSHLQLHKLQPLQCPKCNKLQRSRDQQEYHIWRHLRINFINVFSIYADQTKTLKFIKCIKCKEIVQRGQIWQHWESHLQFGDKIKQEPEVIKTVTNRMTPYIQYLVETVMMAPQRKDDREILRSCQVCDDRKFARWSEMKRHLIEHLLKDALFNKIHNGNLKCQICQQGVELVDTYKRHMREHAGLSLYQCNLCNKTFSDSSNFAKHKKVHNLKVLFCDICNKKYQTKKTLACHLMKHNGSVPLKCDHCYKMFYFATDLKKHVKTKHKMQEYCCSICRQRFTSIKLKLTHEWEVHKERKIKADCPICNEKFRKFSDVKRHVQKHHHGINLDKKIYHSLEKINESNLPIDEIDNILVKKLGSGSISDVE